MSRAPPLPPPQVDDSTRGSAPPGSAPPGHAELVRQLYPPPSAATASSSSSSPGVQPGGNLPASTLARQLSQQNQPRRSDSPAARKIERDARDARAHAKKRIAQRQLMHRTHTQARLNAVRNATHAAAAAAAVSASSSSKSGAPNDDGGRGAPHGHRHRKRTRHQKHKRRKLHRHESSDYSDSSDEEDTSEDTRAGQPRAGQSNNNTLRPNDAAPRTHPRHIDSLRAKAPPPVRYWVMGCALLDPCMWLVFLIVFVSYVQFGVLSRPREEFTLSNKVRHIIGASSSLGDVHDEDTFFGWLSDTLLPNLVPNDIRRVQAFADVATEGRDPTLASIDGKMLVLENQISLRQQRCKKGVGCARVTHAGLTETGSWGSGRGGDWEEQRDADENSWLMLNGTDGTDVEAVCPLQTNPSVEYYRASEVGDNTVTRTSVHGYAFQYSGSGYVEQLNLRLNVSSALSAANTDAYARAMQQTRDCLLAKVQALKAARWIDSRTRAVFVEFCVAPWFVAFDTKAARKQLFEGSPDHVNRIHTAGACERVAFFVDVQGSFLAKQATMTSSISYSKDTGTSEEKARYDSFIVVCSLCVVIIFMKEGTEILWACKDTERRWEYLRFSNLLFNALDLMLLYGLVHCMLIFPESSAFGAESTTYARFELIGRLTAAKGFFSVVLCLWYVRGVEFLSLLPWFELPLRALSLALPNLASFMTVYLFFIYGASMAFRCFLGSASTEFATLENSVTTLSLASLGELKYDSVGSDYRFDLAEHFAILWAFIATFVLLTMFVAIVDQGYQDAKEELNPELQRGERVTVDIVVEGRPYQYQGRVVSAYSDGTYDVKMRVFNQETGRFEHYVDRNMKKSQLHPQHRKDIQYGVLIAILKFHVEPIMRTLWKQGLVHGCRNFSLRRCCSRVWDLDGENMKRRRTQLTNAWGRVRTYINLKGWERVRDRKTGKVFMRRHSNFSIDLDEEGEEEDGGGDEFRILPRSSVILPGGAVNPEVLDLPRRRTLPPLPAEPHPEGSPHESWVD